MGKKTGIFTEGQHVFAKVKGYSPWPAKVSERRENVKKDPETGKIYFRRIFVFNSIQSLEMKVNRVI
jgi:hypothetical protein